MIHSTLLVFYSQHSMSIAVVRTAHCWFSLTLLPALGMRLAVASTKNGKSACCMMQREGTSVAICPCEFKAYDVFLLPVFGIVGTGMVPVLYAAKMHLYGTGTDVLLFLIGN